MGLVDPTIAVALIGAIGAVATTALSIWLRKRLNEVHHQVKNSHETNLRDDVDLMHRKIDRLIDYVIAGDLRHDQQIAAVNERLNRINA